MKTNQKSALPALLMSRSHTTQGLALIEVIAFVFCLGILAAIALPNLLSSNGKNKQVEGKTYVGAMNRAQQAYFEENKGAFADSIEAMGVGIKPETPIYRYLTRRTDRAVFNYAIAKEPKLKSYAGAVWKVTGTDGKAATQAILCEAEKPAAKEPAYPVYVNGQLLCGEGTKMLGK